MGDLIQHHHPGQLGQKHKTLFKNITNAKRAGSVTQVVERLPSKCEAPVLQKKKKKKKIRVTKEVKTWENQELGTIFIYSTNIY
jgi:hypothetical protein